MSEKVIVWFRRDLRIQDNPALNEAVRGSSKVIPVFLWTPAEEGMWEPGGASKWWLHYSLEVLNTELERIGLKLIVRSGESALELLEALIKESSATRVYWNRCYEPYIIERDKKIKLRLAKEGCGVFTFNGGLLFEPWEVETKTGGPYQVYTPFMKACFAKESPRRPFSIPKTKANTPSTISLEVADLNLLPSIPWDSGIKKTWKPGCVEANKLLKEFITSAVSQYSVQRNIPGIRGTSRLSPYLHFGEISPFQIWHEVTEAFGSLDSISKKHSDVRVYLQEIVWREFAHHLLFHFPRTPERPLRGVFEHFPWIEDGERLKAWQRGLTGFPIVDAGMRELWQTGWMHNRVRMIVASFLVKNLLLSWQSGAAWFWDTLVDANLANNTLGWQWSAGCGADAAPYFRIFNPVLQGEKFDPEGTYVRTYVPELKNVPKSFIHKPWEAKGELLKNAGVILGKDYPKPLVDLSESRDEALKAYETLRAFRQG